MWVPVADLFYSFGASVVIFRFEECVEEAEHDQEMAEASEAAVQQMMGFKGRR